MWTLISSNKNLQSTETLVEHRGTHFYSQNLTPVTILKDPYLRTAERAAARVTSENHIGDGGQQSQTPHNGHSPAILTVGVLEN